MMVHSRSNLTPVQTAGIVLGTIFAAALLVLWSASSARDAHAAPLPQASSAPPVARDLRVPAGEKVLEVTPNTYGNTYSGDMPFAYIRVRTRAMLPNEQPETYTVHSYDGTGPNPLTSWKVIESR